jgi:hypothetical protein
MPPIIAAVVAYAVPATGAWGLTFSIGGAVIGSTVSFATLIGYTVTIGAAVAYSSSQNAKMRNALAGSVTDQGRTTMVRDPIANQRGIYGEVLTSGNVMLMHTTGAKNEYLHVVLGMAGHECEAFSKVYFEESTGLVEVPLDGSGNATGKYAGYFICKSHLGDNAQSADATLMAAAPGVWTSTHRLRGIAYAYLQFKYSTDLFPNGVPTVRILTKGKKVFDPRVGIYQKDCDVAAGNTNIGCANVSSLTVGMVVHGKGIVMGSKITSVGASSFSIDTAPLLTDPNASLFIGVAAWTANSALCTADYHADFKLGLRSGWQRINRTALIAEANICDENVVLDDTTTEKRYTANGTFTSQQDATEDLLASMGGRRVDTGGMYSFFAGAYRAPLSGATFTDDDLIGEISIQPRQSMRASYSGVRGTYISPINGWQPADFVPAKNSEYARQDGRNRRWKDVSYAFVTSPSTAQRLAKLDLERGRQQIVVQALYKLKAFKTSCCDTVRLTSSAEGWASKEFEVLSWELKVIGTSPNIGLGIALTMRETAAAVYDWANGEETTVDLAPNTNLPDPSVVGAPTLTLLTDTTTVIVQPDGTVQPQIKVSWLTPNNIYIESGGWVEIEWKKTSDADYVPWNAARGDALFDYITNVKVGLQYNVRARFRNQSGVRGAWTVATSASVVGDTVAPNAPASLTATAKPGFNDLFWPPSTSNTVNEYAIYRSFVSAFAGFSLLANTANSQYQDGNITPGVNYWYYVQATSASEIPSSPTGVAGPVTALLFPSGALPSNAGAPAQPGSPVVGTYLTDSGNVLSFVTLEIPALPAGAAWQNLLLRKTGSVDWTIFAQYKNTVALTVGAGTAPRIDDLSPGIAYDMALQAFNGAGGSSVSTGASFTAAAKTSLPAAPTAVTYVAGNSSSFNRSPTYATPFILNFMVRVNWTPAADKDIKGYEWALTSIDSDAAANGASKFPADKLDEALISSGVAGTAYFRVRSIDSSGNRSAWAGGGISFSAAFLWGIPAGDMSAQNASNVNVSGGTISGITDLAITDGGTGGSSAASARSNLGVSATGADTNYAYRTNNLGDLANVATALANLGVRPVTAVVNLTGGAPTETFTLTHSFGTLQTKILAQLVDPAGLGELNIRHDFTAAGNTTTASVFIASTPGGGNIPAGGRRFTILYFP